MSSNEARLARYRRNARAALRASNDNSTQWMIGELKSRSDKAAGKVRGLENAMRNPEMDMPADSGGEDDEPIDRRKAALNNLYLRVHQLDLDLEDKERALRSVWAEKRRHGYRSIAYAGPLPNEGAHRHSATSEQIVEWDRIEAEFVAAERKVQAINARMYDIRAGAPIRSDDEYSQSAVRGSVSSTASDPVHECLSLVTDNILTGGDSTELVALISKLKLLVEAQ